MKLPPLRERTEDIPILVDHFIRRLEALKGKGITGISPSALRTLMGHHFPGNVRELQNAIEHAFILSPGTLIRQRFLPDSIRGIEAAPSHQGETLEDLERRFIEEVLERNGNNRTAAAKELGIHKSTLYRKIRKLGIELPPVDGRAPIRD